MICERAFSVYVVVIFFFFIVLLKLIRENVFFSFLVVLSCTTKFLKCVLYSHAASLFLSFFLFILCTSEMTRLKKKKKSIIKSLISRLSPLQVLTKHILDLEKV